MQTQTSQIQLKLSLSQQLNQLLEEKAARIGVPVTQFVKHLIIKEVEGEVYPTYPASDWVEEKTVKAMAEKDTAVQVDNVHDFLEKL